VVALKDQASFQLIQSANEVVSFKPAHPVPFLLNRLVFSLGCFCTVCS
jgi:hypothetical protein